MKNSPFILIPIIAVIISATTLIKTIPSTAPSSNIQLKIKELNLQLIELQSIENPSNHNIWHIQHIQRTLSQLNRYDTPKVLGLNHQGLIPVSIVFVLAIIALLYLWKRHQYKSIIKPTPGLNNGPNRTHPGNDPVAEITYWQPMTKGASNFRMQEIKQTKEALIIQPSFEVKLFCAAFISVGVTPIAIRYSLNWQHLDFILDPIISPTSIFIIIGFLIGWVLMKRRVVISKVKQTIYTSGQKVPLHMVYALQVITNIAGGRGHGVYRNSELNLVLKDGNRINLLNHGDEAYFKHQELQLSNLLSVPVWQA